MKILTSSSVLPRRPAGPFLKLITNLIVWALVRLSVAILSSRQFDALVPTGPGLVTSSKYTTTPSGLSSKRR